MIQICYGHSEIIQRSSISKEKNTEKKYEKSLIKIAREIFIFENVSIVLNKQASPIFARIKPTFLLASGQRQKGH